MIPDGVQASDKSFDPPDDFSREVHCILGIPIDVMGMHDALRRIESAAGSKAPFLVSTPNLNFLVNSQLDPDFRESLVLSDLCTADGMAVVCIAWLVGIPITNRIAGSDIFDALKSQHKSEHPLKIFFFGGLEGVAATASQVLNSKPSGLYCVGSLCPGFGSIDEMSRDEIIDNINSSGADFLVASLGAQKGQLWLLRNHNRLAIPVRAHLGAAINFQAGTVRRAPFIIQKIGLEWLWRIKEEPYLWRRYWNDGRALLRLLFTRIFPLMFWTWWMKLKYESREASLNITRTLGEESITLILTGPATSQNVDVAILALREAIATKKQIVLDFSNSRIVDLRFLGLLLMLKKRLKATGANAYFIGLSPELKKLFRLNMLEFA